MSDRELLARRLVKAFNLNGPDFDHVSEMHRLAAFRMADEVESFYGERLGGQTAALRKIAYLRPGGPIPGGPAARGLVEQMERLAVDALSASTASPAISPSHRLDDPLIPSETKGDRT